MRVMFIINKLKILVYERGMRGERGGGWEGGRREREREGGRERDLISYLHHAILLPPPPQPCWSQPELGGAGRLKWGRERLSGW